MAIFFPTRNSCLARMTAGEKRFSERLQQKLEDDYSVWYDVPIGIRQRHPDFVILHPRRGLLVLEVKDWKQSTIKQANRQSFTLITQSGLKTAANPLIQARAGMLEIDVLLQRDPQLRYSKDHKHAGKPIMPRAHGVVLTNITRKQFDEGGLADIIAPHLVICRDEMQVTVEVEDFQERLWAMFPWVFPVAMSLPQIDRVRWYLFPELRVTPGNGQLGLFDDNDISDKNTADNRQPPTIPDIVRVMDAQQEQLARSLGDEHRIIHGVAGSGKTMILGFRALHLARFQQRPILILCYNKTLAARLERLVADRGINDKVQIYNFHRWCRQMLLTYHQPLPANGPGFVSELVKRVIHAVDKGLIPRHQYGAVLIDEGHDFEPDWYKLIVQMIDPHTNSLLVLYDDAQNIYGEKSRRQTSWKSLGIQAQGRTTILRLNYRNTMEVLAVARQFAKTLLQERQDGDDGIPLISPESAGRRGPLPELARFSDTWSEQTALVEQLQTQHANGHPWHHMGIIYRHHYQGKQLTKALAKAEIPYRMAGYNTKRELFDGEDSVKLLTMHSCKGLEFPLVYLPQLGEMPDKNSDTTDEMRLLYVAMTRATDELLMTHHKESAFTREVRASLHEIEKQLADTFTA